MMKTAIFLACFFVISTSGEYISKKKTIPISQETCPCWWDLEGKLIDPKTNEPFKCACCKPGGRQCGYPMHEWCTVNKKKNRRGCVGTANWMYTLSELGHPCHFDKSRNDCAWCTPQSYQCGPPGYPLPSANPYLSPHPYEHGQYCQRYSLNFKDCGGESLDCRLQPGICGPNASCVKTNTKVSHKWWYHKCVCNDGFIGNGFTCAEASNLANVSIPKEFTVTLQAQLTKDKFFDPTLEPTIDHSLADDLYGAMDGVESSLGDCAHCDATVLKCGRF